VGKYKAGPMEKTGLGKGTERGTALLEEQLVNSGAQDSPDPVTHCSFACS
jgi:hypothetical protein